jgi:tagatose-1,6-bisphosphate aldolase
VPEPLDDLVYRATRTDVSDRLDSVDRFLDELDRIEQDSAVDLAAPAGVDPLTAAPGQSLDGTWTVERVLGTGATARVLLVYRESDEEGAAGHSERRVLKVDLDETRADRCAPKPTPWNGSAAASW